MDGDDFAVPDGGEPAVDLVALGGSTGDIERIGRYHEWGGMEIYRSERGFDDAGVINGESGLFVADADGVERIRDGEGFGLPLPEKESALVAGRCIGQGLFGGMVIIGT